MKAALFLLKGFSAKYVRKKNISLELSYFLFAQSVKTEIHEQAIFTGFSYITPIIIKDDHIFLEFCYLPKKCRCA